MSRSRLQSLNSNIDHMKCSLSSKNSPRNTVDFEAACSVYIRFRGVNGYPGSDRIEIITGDHTSIVDEDHAVEAESLVQVGDGLADGGVVHFVAGPDVMRDRPAGHHHHGNDHLDVVRLAIAAVAVLGKIGRPGALEIGAGDVLEHQVRLEAEQVAEVMIRGPPRSSPWRPRADRGCGTRPRAAGSGPGLACAGASWARTGGPGDRRGSQFPASRPGDVRWRGG